MVIRWTENIKITPYFWLLILVVNFTVNLVVNNKKPCKSIAYRVNL
jgi:hypothetical protein